MCSVSAAWRRLRLLVLKDAAAAHVDTVFTIEGWAGVCRSKPGALQ